MTIPLADVLVEARVARGMTQKAVAEATGFTVAFIKYYEEIATHNVTLATIFKYCNALKLKVQIDASGVTIEDENENVLLKSWRPDIFLPVAVP